MIIREIKTTYRTKKIKLKEMNTPHIALSIASKIIGNDVQEQMIVFLLDTKLNYFGHEIISKGTVSYSSAAMRDVFRAAIRENAFTIIVAHNHPSLNGIKDKIVPSAEDLEFTKRLIEAGNLLGVPLLDHGIVSGKKLYSIREHYQSIKFE